ncbi:MAG TPA: SRPBCC family protein [Polyangiaceae bacterium]|nr:SRPBCC family protein [Polyangiaceae bacterium]
MGLFSVGLGLAELLSPASIAALIGIPNNPRSRLVLRALGARELLSGVGLLLQPQSAGWLWSRVGGDAMDLALLGDGFTSRRSNRARLIAATAAVAGVTAIDALSAARQSRSSLLGKVGAPIHVLKTITINRAPSEVYEFWREFENLPKFMAHLESVRESNGVSTWTATGPAGSSFSWQAEVVVDRPGACIGWRSLEGSTSVPNRGTVNFLPAPGQRGTEVRVELNYEPPGGALGAAFAKLFGEEPGQQVQSDLRRLKQVLETGEVLHSDASIHRGAHPAQPSKAEVKVMKGAAE